MAKLTPLAKGLISVIVIAGAISAVWNLGGKKLWQSFQGKNGGTAGAPHASGWGMGSKNGSSGALGTADDPLKVSIVSFHGYAPALVANGNSLKTKSGSIYAQEGVNVEFLIQDDIPTLATIFESGTAQCAWRTSDFWAQEQPNLRNAGLDAKAVMVVDNTRGADAIITNKPNINKIEDLAGHKVGVLQFTPSHGMLIDAIESSSLTARKKSSIEPVFINAEEGTAGVRAAFESNNVDAAALWDPDLSIAMEKVPGAKVIYSTKTANNLIFDVMVCDQRVLDNPTNQETIQKFVSGWMKGVTEARANPDNAVDALIETEEFFKLLADEKGKPFIKQLFSNLVWTDLKDNARILGLAGDTNHYERVYKRFDEIYRGAGALANPKSPVINPQESFDYRYIKNMLAADSAAVAAAAKPEHEFSATERAKATGTTAAVTKPVTVNFATGRAALSKRAQQIIDKEMVPFIENNGSAYFEVSGNTDSVGAQSTNQRLSEKRADAVVDYLVQQWEFPAARFKKVGNGSSNPICNESNPASEGLSLDDCRSLNRTTRIAVYSR